jgi:hypothetical protein
MQVIEVQPAHSQFNRLRNRERRPSTVQLVACLLLMAGSLCAHAQLAPVAAPVDPNEIVRKMVAQNDNRVRQLKYFTARRHYHVDFNGLGRSMTADMHVQVTYTAGQGKSFQVIDQSGSHVLVNHVLLKLIETEKDDSQQQTSALTPVNYNFVFDSQTSEAGRPLYIFTVEPKVKSKLLFRGRIWIDGRDFAVVRVEAQPAENPSFWIKETDVHHEYAKSGGFWLPQSNRSESKIRFGGTAVLTIDYGTYQF